MNGKALLHSTEYLGGWFEDLFCFGLLGQVRVVSW